ncbi:MAG TPA: hypothetical protein VLC91_04930 [Spongiibacteraceae bacterium]|nr:hypothetical protein [Spongiibacteraceae bacterium]
MKSISMVVVLFASSLFLSSLFLIMGCSNREVYDSLQGAKQNECNKIVDNNERQRCFDDAGKSYDRYRREREAEPVK